MQHTLFRRLALFATCLALVAARGQSITKHVSGAGFAETKNSVGSIRGTFGQSAVGSIAGGGQHAGLGFWTAGSSLGDASAASPASITLLTNSPNPFRASTTLRYRLASPGDVELQVFAENGNPVRSMRFAQRQSGTNEQVFTAGELPTGTYMYTLAHAGEKRSGTMTSER